MSAGITWVAEKRHQCNTSMDRTAQRDHKNVVAEWRHNSHAGYVKVQRPCSNLVALFWELSVLVQGALKSTRRGFSVKRDQDNVQTQVPVAKVATSWRLCYVLQRQDPVGCTHPNRRRGINRQYHRRTTGYSSTTTGNRYKIPQLNPPF